MTTKRPGRLIVRTVADSLSMSDALSARLPVSLAVGSNAIGTAAAYGSTGAATGTAVPASLDLTDLRWGHTEYNVGRTAETTHGTIQLPVPYDAAEGLTEPVIAIPRVPLSANAQKVAAIVAGAWVAGFAVSIAEGVPECDPQQGVHPPVCGHRANRVRFTRYGAAVAAFGEGGGSQLRQVDDALDELYDEGTEYLVHDAATGSRLRQRGRILELSDLRRGERDDVLYEVRWGAYLLDSLLAGHFQSFPVELVRSLRGSDFLTWLAVLCQVGTSKLVKAGQTHAWTVWAPRGYLVTIDPKRLGLGRQRPDKLRASLERAAERGNAIAEPRLGLRLAVESSAAGGLKLVLTRTKDRASLRLDPVERPAIGDVPTGNLGRAERQSRTGDRQSGTRNERETAPPDRKYRQGSYRQGVETERRRTTGRVDGPPAKLGDLLDSVVPAALPPLSMKGPKGKGEPSTDPETGQRRSSLYQQLLAAGLDPSLVPDLAKLYGGTPDPESDPEPSSDPDK